MSKQSYIPVAPSRIRTYQLSDDPYLLHIIELGHEDTYAVFMEDAFGLEPWHTGLRIMNANEIYINFEIIIQKFMVFVCLIARG